MLYIFINIKQNIIVLFSQEIFFMTFFHNDLNNLPISYSPKVYRYSVLNMIQHLLLNFNKTSFKIYLKEALKYWKQKCGATGILIGEEILFTLFFANDQAIAVILKKNVQNGDLL